MSGLKIYSLTGILSLVGHMPPNISAAATHFTSFHADIYPIIFHVSTFLP